MNYYNPDGLAKHRPNKRECLKKIFTKIKDSLSTSRLTKIEYITFGGSDFADLHDLASSLQGGKIRIASVISFENDARTFELAQNSPTADLLRIFGQKIKVIHNSFPDGLNRSKRPPRCQRVFFLDYFGTFDEENALHLAELLDSRDILPDDWLIITSCLDGRVVKNERFITKHVGRCQLFFQMPNPSKDFVVRNFVDTMVKLAIDTHRKIQPRDYCVKANLVSKYYYADTTPMGVWCFKLEKCVSSNEPIYLVDMNFTRIGAKKKKVASRFRRRIISRGPRIINRSISRLFPSR